MNIGKYLQAYSEDLKLKNYSKITINNYISQVSCFLNHFNKTATKPSEISERNIKDWLLQAKSVNGRRHKLSAIKLFYTLTGKQPMKFKYIEYPRKEQNLPIVLSQQEIQRMFSVCENTKHRVILALLYSTGLRVSELLNLKFSHIDRTRMVINIIGGKGNKDRQVMLDESVLKLLEKYYYEYTPKEFVLNGQSGCQYTASSIRQVIKQLAEKAGINKRVWVHLIRHCSFTHLVEQGVDINLIQRLAGHANVKTTSIYTHISHNIISKIPSPIKSIKL